MRPGKGTVFGSPGFKNRWGQTKDERGVWHEPVRKASEVAELFGFVSTRSLRSSFVSGAFPKPDAVLNTTKGGKTYVWKLSTLRAEAKRRQLKVRL